VFFFDRIACGYNLGIEKIKQNLYFLAIGLVSCGLQPRMRRKHLAPGVNLGKEWMENRAANAAAEIFC
jgi:hypothetical protein